MNAYHWQNDNRSTLLIITVARFRNYRVRRTHQKLCAQRWRPVTLARTSMFLFQREATNSEGGPIKTSRIHSVSTKMMKSTSGMFQNLVVGRFCLFGAQSKHICFRFFDLSSRALQDSADRLRSSFEDLGPRAGFLSTQTAREVLVKTGLSKDELRKIWNLSDIDRDGYFDFDEYVVAMFLCDAVIQKGRPIPKELPASVIPPSKRGLLKKDVTDV